MFTKPSSVTLPSIKIEMYNIKSDQEGTGSPNKRTKSFAGGAAEEMVHSMQTKGGLKPTSIYVPPPQLNMIPACSLLTGSLNH